MILIAPAKINLGLNVFKKEKDFKKHRIYSLMTKIDELHDIVEIEENQQCSENVIQYYLDKNEFFIQDCIVSRTIKYLNEKFQLKNKYKISIKKHIPLGGGLGGGSSDAATVIKAIFKYENITLNELDLYDIALNLGSDIPFFLTEYKSGIVSNYGDKIQNFELPPKLKITVHIVNTSISTPIVFKEFENMDNKLDNINNYELFIKSINDESNIVLINDLQKPCFKLQPELENFWNEFSSLHDYITLTGSGATIIGLDYKKG